MGRLIRDSWRAATKLTPFRAAQYNFDKLQAKSRQHFSAAAEHRTPGAARFLIKVMTIRERLEADILAAMRNRDQQRLDALRYLKSAINRVEIDRRTTLDDEGVTEVVVRQVKDRRDSIRMFEEGGRQDLVEKETADLVIIEEYMPPQMGEEELMALITETISQVGAESMRDKGRVMGRLMPQLQGKADGQQVNAIVTRILESGG